MMTDDDRDQTGSTEQPKKPTALLLECWRGETRQAQVFWVDADHIVPKGTSVVLELQPGEGLLQAAKRIADGLQFPQTAEQWRSLGLLPEALPTLRQALLEAIEAADRGAPHKVTGDLVSSLVIVAHEEEPSKPKRRQRPKTPIRDVLQVGSGHGDRLLHHVFCHKGLLQVGPDSPFPRAVFRWQKQEVAVELSPPEAEGTLLLPEQEALLATKMGEMAQRLGAVDAVVFCILQDLWIQKARHPDERILCHVDYLLEMRGLKPRRNQDGRAGGYRPEDRAEAIAAVNRLRHLAFDVEYQVREGRGKTARLTSVRRRGRALEVSDTMDLGQGRLEFEPGSRQYELRAFLFSPGPVLAATLMGNQEVGRQVAALNRRALCYNPQKQGLELALALYLATLWRCGASKNGVGVRRHKPGAILEAVGVEVDRRHPSRTLQSLEAALNTLHKDGLIAGWEWDDTRWNSVDFYTERRHAPGWVNAWLQAACVLIEAPAEVAQAYSTIPPARPAPALPATIPSDLGTRLRERRLALGMTGLQAAEQMGIDRTLLGHIETGRRRPSKGAATKILAWLE